MNGFAIIVLGLIAFGVLHTSTENFEPWQWYVHMIAVPCGWMQN